jgi:hypothetical protein
MKVSAMSPPAIALNPSRLMGEGYPSLPVRLYEGVGHEPARHCLESLPLDGQEYTVDGDMVAGNAGAGGVAPAVDGHAARDVSCGNRVTVFLPTKIFYTTNRDRTPTSTFQKCFGSGRILFLFFCRVKYQNREMSASKKH